MPHQANPTAGMAALVSGALRVGRDHIAATVSTLFLAYAGAALPSLILFVTGQDSLGTVATTELVAVGGPGPVRVGRADRRRALTTVLAALVTTEAPPEVQARPTGDGRARTGGRDWPAGGPDGDGTGGPKRVGVGSAAGAGSGGAGAGLCPAVHGPTCPMPWSISTAAAGWPPRTCQPRPGRPLLLAGRVTRLRRHSVIRVRARPARRRTD
jgi:YibE/F-like protein